MTTSAKLREMENFMLALTDDEKSIMIGLLSMHVVVPSWFDKECIEGILGHEITKCQYYSILKKTEKSSDMFSEQFTGFLEKVYAEILVEERMTE
jgi:hypothetical protein